jgi:ribosomal protein S6--L-glutamate ligase
MRFLVLSRSPHIASTRSLVRAAESRGHSVDVVDVTRLVLLLTGERATLQIDRETLPLPDVVIPRVPSSVASYGLPMLDQFSSLGVAVLNSARAIGQSRNPVRCLMRLKASGLSVPATVMARSASVLMSLVPQVGGTPVLVKLLQGHERRGVMACESKQSLKAALEAVLSLKHSVVMQEYVSQTGRDLRVFVVGGKAIAAVARSPRLGRLSRTLTRKAQLEAVELDTEIADVAQKAAAVCELEVCAVDLLQNTNQPTKVFEVNACPAIGPMQAATHVDLAVAMIRRAEELATAAVKQQAIPPERA